MEITPRLILDAMRFLAAGAAIAGPRHLRQPVKLLLAGLLLYPTLRRNCAWHGPVVTRFKTNQKLVWLTIDDGPDLRSTPEYLDILARHGVPATFFAIGRQVGAHQALCRRLVEAGHRLENHSQNHLAGFWWAAGPGTVAREMLACSEAIRRATGQGPRYFRSPVGMNGPWVHRAARANSLRVVGWSVPALDACPGAPSRIVERLMAGVHPGAILVLHTGRDARHRARTLDLLLAGLGRAGYRCVIPGDSELC